MFGGSHDSGDMSAKQNQIHYSGPICAVELSVYVQHTDYGY